MSLDVTYQQRQRRPSPRKMKRGMWLVIALVAVNIGVFVYHGDPRERMPVAQPAASSSGAAAKPEPASKDATATAPASREERSPERPQPEQRLVNADGDAVEPWRADALIGVRTPGPVQKVKSVKLASGQTVAQALVKAGVMAADANAAVSSLVGLIDFRRLRPGNKLTARLDGDGALLSLDVSRGPEEKVRAERPGPDAGWQAKRIEVAIDTLTTTVQGEIRSSLWEALTAIDEDPRLAMEIADIFAWEIDFYTQVYPGDRFTVLVDKRYADGRFVGYGAVHAAAYTSGGHVYRAFRHETDGPNGKVAGYYDEKGQSLRKQLLKSPLKYANVTSRFGSRKHPILGYTRAHNGVDYGVPIGTPIWSVGDGRVVKAGWHGGNGKYVEIHHANGWLSQYAHLSQINVKVGQRVAQKDIIGLVGSTGLSTGPHLHYGLKKNGSYVDPQRQNFERQKALEGAERERFEQSVALYREKLEAGALARDGGQPTPTEG